MAKKDDLAKDLSLGRPRRNLKKSVDTSEERAKEVVKKVVEQPEAAVEPEVVAEKLIRTTIDLPQSIHRAIKIQCASEGISLKDYIISLVKTDLNL